MAEPLFRFQDGASYERMMGKWSRLAGDVFLDWLAPPAGLKWLDVGCGNGAFTEAIVERCAPAAVDGVDPSDAQIAFARTRPAARLARFDKGDAMSLPFRDASFDVAVMALVIFFVPDPPQGVAEMRRALRPGGMAAAYAWDVLGGGFPLYALMTEMRALGARPPDPPSASASRIEAMRQLWTDAGFEAIGTREIVVERSFADFDDLWETSRLGTSVRPALEAMPAADIEQIKARLRERFPADRTGRITYSARANAVKGRVAR